MEPNLAQLNNNSTQAIHNLAQPQHNQLKPSLNTSALTIFHYPKHWPTTRSENAMEIAKIVWNSLQQ